MAKRKAEKAKIKTMTKTEPKEVSLAKAKGKRTKATRALHVTATRRVIVVKTPKKLKTEQHGKTHRGQEPSSDGSPKL
jgi:hypothetical protein